MTQLPYPYTARCAVALAACLSVLALPSIAFAGDGGAGIGSTGTTTTSSGTTTTGTTTTGSSPSPYGSVTAPIAATPADTPVTASANGLSIATTTAGTYRHTMTFTGQVSPASAGETVEIERRASSGSWVGTAHATVPSSGSYTVRSRATRTGQVSFRALLIDGGSASGAPVAGAASASPATPAVTVAIFTDAVATIYGPGFYGKKTACGSTLTQETVGVASRTLACGTEVEVYYHGQSVTVPVIDRGPFANGASWDLTEATAAALGLTGTSTIGTIAG